MEVGKESYGWRNWSEERDESLWWKAKWPIHSEPIFAGPHLHAERVEEIPGGGNGAPDGLAPERRYEFWADVRWWGAPQADGEGDE